MATILQTVETGAHTSLPTENVDPKWYAAYTSANHEKRVAEQLGVRLVEHFVPLYESMRCWKDRKVRLQLPLFPGYVFVRLTRSERLRVLQVPGVARLVGFNGLPCALPDSDIESLKNGLVHGVRAEPHPFLTVGRHVSVIRGPLAGQEGILIRRKGNWRVVLSVQLIMRSIAVDLDIADVVPLSRSVSFDASAKV